MAEVRSMLEEQQAVEAINQQIRALEQQHGFPFTEEEVQAVGRLIDEGHDPQQAYATVDPLTEDEREWADEVEHFEAKTGRPLVESEQANVWQAVQDGEEEIELHDLDNTEGRRSWAAERYSESFEQPEVPEVVEMPADDASAEERKQYMSARLEGAQAHDPYSAGEPTE